VTKARTNADNVAGDISGVTAGTGLTGGGTSGAVTLDLSTPVASTNGGTGLSSYTTGDLVYSSSGNTLSKLGIGSNGQYLTVSSGIPSWGTVNTTTTVSAITSDVSVGTGSSFTISGLSTNYIEIHVKGLISASNWSIFWLRLNNLSTSIYDSTLFAVDGGSSPVPVWTRQLQSDTKLIASYPSGTPIYGTETYNFGILRIYNAQTSGFKPVRYTAYFQNGGYISVDALIRTTAAVTSVTGLTSGGSTFNAGTYTVYGG
jgi:hypothetical protein